LGEGVGRDAGPRAVEGRPAGVGLDEGQVEARGLEQAARGGNDLLPDAVTGDEADGGHWVLLDARDGPRPGGGGAAEATRRYHAPPGAPRVVRMARNMPGAEA